MPIDPGLRPTRPITVAVLAALLLGTAATAHLWLFNSTIEQNSAASLEREWSAMKGYLRLERGVHPSEIRARWYYDNNDREEATAVSRIKDRLVVMDHAGRTIHQPVSLPGIEPQLAAVLNTLDSRDVAVFREITHDDDTYLVRAGVLFDESRGARYPAALAVRLNRNGRAFFVSLLGAIVGALLLGWSIPRITRRTAD